MEAFTLLGGAEQYHEIIAQVRRGDLVPDPEDAALIALIEEDEALVAGQRDRGG